eukprot:TRINITY_DN6300_c0_g1_i1.p1 TRINITY_DN6300_c0_g1~~TRINITY_DN6300_c0_g1_i1.p1  ORF type:complete len:737 (+),score=173.80 TRINITY_DN6300_c0_g1_i1:48-2258(+)
MMEFQAGSAIQIVDYDGNWNPKLFKYVEDTGLVKVGKEYATVGVLGCQSSGKSTLLNLMFGTPFEVMNDDERRQTTQGIWLARAVEMPIFVLDIEGTDSAERGDDHMAFERKSSLLAVALCDVVVVNMWEHDVGRHDAANYTLLKTVFEVNLQLRSDETKTLLMFVLRDHSTTPLTRLAASLKKDMDHLWQGATKPDRWADTNFSELFDTEFVSLPHKVHQPDKFRSEVADLRARFSFDDLLRPIYRKGVPADGFADYASRLWEQIISCKDVDIPTTRTLLAVYRCDELARAATESFHLALQSLQTRVLEGVVPHFSSEIHTAMQNAIREFDELGRRYDDTVYKERRDVLMRALVLDAETLFRKQLKRAHEMVVAKLKAILAQTKENFAGAARVAVTDAMHTFSQLAQESVVESSGWQFNDEQELLQATLDEEVALERGAREKRLLDDAKHEIEAALVAADDILNKAELDTWSKATSLLVKALQDGVVPAEAKLRELGVSNDAAVIRCVHLAERARSALLAVARGSAAFAAPRLKQRFDQHFHFDADRVPRVFTGNLDISALYVVARDKALEMLDVIAVATIPSPVQLLREAGLDAPEDISGPADCKEVLLTAQRKSELASSLEQEARATVREARQLQEAARASVRAPFWMYMALVVLGWNELMAVLFNPFYLLLTVIVVTAYLVYGDDIWKLAKPVISMIVRQVALRAPGVVTAAPAAIAALNSNKDGEEKEKGE